MIFHTRSRKEDKSKAHQVSVDKIYIREYTENLSSHAHQVDTPMSYVRWSRGVRRAKANYEGYIYKTFYKKECSCLECSPTNQSPTLAVSDLENAFAVLEIAVAVIGIAVAIGKALEIKHNNSAISKDSNGIDKECYCLECSPTRLTPIAVLEHAVAVLGIAIALHEHVFVALEITVAVPEIAIVFQQMFLK